jgi:hypothetical protein
MKDLGKPLLDTFLHKNYTIASNLIDCVEGNVSKIRMDEEGEGTATAGAGSSKKIMRTPRESFSFQTKNK